MLGTAEERKAKRDAQARETARRNAIVRRFGDVNIGVVQLLEELMVQRGVSMNMLLHRLALDSLKPSKPAALSPMAMKVLHAIAVGESRWQRGSEHDQQQLGSLKRSITLAIESVL